MILNKNLMKSVVYVNYNIYKHEYNNENNNEQQH